MTQILSLIVFLRELVFGRVKNVHRTRGQLIRSSIVVAVLAASLYGNYLLTKSMYSITARSISLQRKMADYDLMKDKLALAESKIATYETVLGRFGDYFPMPPVPAPVPPAPPAAPSKVPLPTDGTHSTTLAVTPPRDMPVKDPKPAPIH